MTSIDLKLFNVSEASDIGYFDVQIDDNGDFVLEDGLDSSIWVSLFADQRATADEIQSPILRRGWWGDLLSDFSGHQVGSKLWLLEQSRLTPGTVSSTKAYIDEALKWLQTDGFVTSSVVSARAISVAGIPSIEVSVSFNSELAKIDLKKFNIVKNTFA